MDQWISDFYRNVDAMNLDGFIGSLSADAIVVVGNQPPMHGRAAVRNGISHFWEAIGGLKHNFIDVVEAKGKTLLELKVDYLRKDGQTVTVPCVTVLERQGDLVSAARIYLDVTPVFA